MSIKKITGQEGIGLVEVIFSLGIAVVILTSLVSLSLFTLRTSVQNKLLIKGSSLATQELELVRAYRDSNDWGDFLDELNTAENCDTDDCSMVTSPSLDIQSGSKTSGSTTAETVTISFRSSNCKDSSGGDVNVGSCVRISVQTSWLVGNDTKYVHNYTELSNW